MRVPRASPDALAAVRRGSATPAFLFPFPLSNFICSDDELWRLSCQQCPAKTATNHPRRQT
ncbi:hypothetical protein CBM2615_B190049 [Cupriavidus taiwanensis]|uniref:Uncharacterized protein n=1 Tax=Cupriavidus taiwanensis TaxID=164546 RepID=A0A375EC32_9BURK|nr:hypothetical protein CBM2614_B200048 [Cupriavidus taiwanensis]SOZ67045.1 hypothetical protein CBM2615_B190049 [Cupriavidus taiwanensis]SOZ70574.1 hypothetical protein CBM2613_B170013 [Cupriavidus taiwanensis]SPA08726.1 hypothetical protein CBM2625_B170048 [Cupriavidus taiwanensis]